MLNSVVLMGRLTADPEIKIVGDNVSVCRFTLAVDRDLKPKDGERQADFIGCTAWRHTAEFIAKYFQKGVRMAVCGRIATRTWTDDNGGKRYATDIIVNSAYFADAKREGATPTEPAALPAGLEDYGAVPEDFDDANFPF